MKISDNPIKTMASRGSSQVALMLVAFLLGWLIRGKTSRSGSEHDLLDPNGEINTRTNPGQASDPAQFNAKKSHAASTTPLHSLSGQNGTSLQKVDLNKLFISRNPLTRISDFIEVLRDLGPDTIDAVRTAFETLPAGESRTQEMQLFFHAWATFAPLDAIDYAQTLGRSETMYATRSALASWAAYNAPAAMQWSKANPDENKKGEYMVGIIQGVATIDLGAASDLLYGMNNTNYRFQAASVLVRNHVNEGIEPAMKWADELPDGDQHLKNIVLNQVASEVAQRNPERCAEWALELEEGEGRKRVIATVINYWSRSSHEAVAAWVKELPEGGNKYHAIEQMVNQWAWRNPVSTANWLNNFPANKKLDPSIDNFARRIMHKEPATAVSWAHSIVNDERRNKSLNHVFQNWQKKKPDEAMAWAESNAPELLPDTK
ncbi:MAG: hypothetical protein HOK49_15235 [Opitutae bacterium]|nr:hypothetical protein [Opitutae bacterium]MBT6463870.1 hypothetical protein [Opitutae bacterium]